MNRPTHHSFKWNGFQVEAEAYINGNDVEFDSIEMYDDNNQPIDLLTAFCYLTPVQRTSHVKNPMDELTTLFLEAEAEYHNDMVDGTYFSSCDQ